MVTVYILDICQLNQEALFRQQYEKQPKERQEKIMRIADRMEKNRSLGAGIVLARGLFAYGIDATQVQFRKNAHGKPDLKDRQEIHFNLSHSGNYVVGAFADTPVGIDIEHRRENVEKPFFLRKSGKKTGKAPVEWMWRTGGKKSGAL